MKLYENIVHEPNEAHQSLAAKVMIPLLDALNWKGDNGRLMQSMSNQEEDMNIDDLIDTMANLNFHHERVKHINAHHIDKWMLPVLMVSEDNYYLIINIGESYALVFDAASGIYTEVSNSKLKGDVYTFKHVGEIGDSILHTQSNWFTKLVMRFDKALKKLIGLTFLLTMLDLLIPLFIILIYNQIGATGNDRRLLMLLAGVVLYFAANVTLSYYRGLITNYISARMGNVISQQVFRQLLYLTPGYTETASISSQINRVIDFENLKRFTNSGIFINLLELCFSAIYVIAIFFLGGWLGFIPIITFFVVLILGMSMRPFHKIRMEKASEARAERQQTLLEILKNTDEIKRTGMKEHWIERYRKISAKSIYTNYIQAGYVAGSNNLIYFVTNASVIIVIYGGVLQVFENKMSMGALIGIILLYWKVLATIRGATSLFVQVGGLSKSIAQINRFMKLPIDTNLRANMVATKAIKGKVIFQDVSIRYKQTSKAALVNINFLANPGEILGLTGHDGAGKTTILKLVLGMYIPQGGRIIIDSHNIKQLEPLTLRQSVSYAPARDMIFLGTFRSNFRNVNPGISDERISEIAAMTGLAAYMMDFDYSLDTPITEPFLNELSPSFKKLFCLTRMLARDVKLYLIDEPENHLNANDLDRVIRLVRILSKEQKATVIISTKNKQILNHCNTVVTLNQGRVSETVTI